MFRYATVRLSVLFLLVLISADSVRAQVLPGVPESRIRAGRGEFTAEVLRSVNELMGEWKRAWEDDDVDETRDFYTDEALVVLPGGERIQGRDAIGEALGERILPTSGEVITRQLDLVASGRMAVSTGRFWFQVEEEGIIVDRSGTYVMVLLRNGRHWQIRSQLFSDEGTGLGI